MNNFDRNFFSKYVPEGHTMLYVFHVHMITIFYQLFVNISLFLIVPVILYYYSGLIQSLLPFYIFEIYIFGVFIKLIYDVFDWYNDVWIVTSQGIVSLRWAFLKVNTDTVNFDNIEGVGVEQNGILDKIFIKGDLVIHKIGDDSFVLEHCANPYRAVDIIENIEVAKDEPTDKLELILEALQGVVDNYMVNNYSKKRNKTLRIKIIQDIKDKKDTIDLRK